MNYYNKHLDVIGNRRHNLGSTLFYKDKLLMFVIKNYKGFAHPLLLLFFVAMVATATSLYLYTKDTTTVGTSNYPRVAGVNTSPCTPNLVVGASESLKTVEAAVNALGNNGSGKVICIKNDKVYGVVPVIQVSGSQAAPLVIKGHPANPERNGTKKPIFRDDTAYPKWQDRDLPGIGGSPIFNIKANHVILQDVEVARSAKTGIDLGGTADNNLRENIQLINVVVHDTYADGIRVLYANNVLIDNCELYRNEMVGTVTDCMSYPNAQCSIGEVLKVRHSDRVTVQNCSIREDMSKGRGGVLNTDSSNTTYKNNEVYMNTGNMLHIGDASNVVMENNLVYAVCGEKANGLYKLAERYPPTKNPYNWKGGTNYTLKNNLIVGMAKGLNFSGCEGYVLEKGDTNKIWQAGHPCPFNNVLIENNTVVSTGNQNSKEDETKEFSLVIGDQRNDPVANVRIRNNIFQSVEDGTGNHEDVDIKAQGDIVFSGNIFHDREQLGQGDIQVNNLTGVFSQNPNLNSCITGRIDKTKYRVAQAYAGKGADISKVGRNVNDEDNDDEPTPVCGNGIQEQGESCDLGSANGVCPSTCSTSCTVNTCDGDDDPTPVCGNGIQEQGEACDLGSANGACPSTCNTSCTVNTCDGDDDDEDETPSDNLILNGGFKLPAQTDEIARYWKFTSGIFSGTLGNVTASIIRARDTDLAKAEAVRIDIVKNPVTMLPALNQENVDLNPSTSYDVRFVARASVRGQVKIYFKDMGYINESLAPTASFNVEKGWQAYTARITTKKYNPNKATLVSIRFKMPNGSNIVIDNVSIREIAQ